MQVSKCSENVVPQGVSYAELKRIAGKVYRNTKPAYEGVRWIVVDRITVLIYENNSIYTASNAWDSDFFIPTNETVCFELKPA